MSPIPEIANLLINRLNLSPPVDVDKAVAAHAVLEECDWPHDCDGVAILDIEHSKIFIRRDRPRRRKRFTKAHELGHVVIGWHLKSVQCIVDPTEGEHHNSLKSAQESEANLFASHLLVPDSLLFPFGFTYFSPSEALTRIEQADVSAAAGVMALRRILLPGYAFHVPGVGNPILSSGTDLSGGNFREAKKKAIRHDTIIHQGKSVQWLQLAEAHEITQGSEDPLDLLYSVLSKARPHQDAEHLKKSIYGVIGGVIGSTLARARKGIVEPEHILGILRYKFSIHHEYADLMSFGDFEQFLSHRARELSDQHRERNSSA